MNHSIEATSIEDCLRDDYQPVERFFPEDHRPLRVITVGNSRYKIPKQFGMKVSAVLYEGSPKVPDEPETQRLQDIASLSYPSGNRGVTDEIIAFPEGLTVQTSKAIIPGILGIPNEGIAVASLSDITEDELALKDDDIKEIVMHLRNELSLVKHDEPLLSSEEVIEIFRHGALSVYEKLGFQISDLDKMESGGSVANALKRQGAWRDLADSITNITRQELKKLFSNTTWDPIEVVQHTFGALHPRRWTFSIEIVQSIQDHQMKGELGLENGSVLFSVQSGSGLLGRMSACNYPLDVDLLNPRSEAGLQFLRSQIIATNFAYANRLWFLALMRDIMMDIKNTSLDLELITDRSHHALDCLSRETTKESTGEPILLHRHRTVRCEPVSEYTRDHPFARIGTPFRCGLGLGGKSALMRKDRPSPNTYNTAPVRDVFQEPNIDHRIERLFPRHCFEPSFTPSRGTLSKMIEMLEYYSIADLLGYVKPLAVFKP